jgi:glyoxylase-like metal-dependent hydrolase (beta-lactamase superfamily II)
MKVVACTWVAMTVALSAEAQSQGIDYEKTQIIPQRLAPHFYALTGSAGVDPGHPEGAGGRIGILVGSDGVFMVDASYAPLSEKIAATIKAIDPGPIRFLVNTHYHPDHTGGNPNFVKRGAVLLARDEVRQALIPLPPPALLAAVGAAASWKDPERLPTVTFMLGSPVKIYFDSETVDLIPLPAAHTNGDVMVRFETSDVIMIGDFYRNYGYPFVDAAGGGSFNGVLAAIDLLLRTAGPNTKLVPGHGSLPTRADIEGYRDMILDVRAKVQAMAAAGKTLPEVLAAKLTAPYDVRVPGGTQPLPGGLGTSADRFVSTLYGEVKAGK